MYCEKLASDQSAIWEISESLIRYSLMRRAGNTTRQLTLFIYTAVLKSMLSTDRSSEKLLQ